MGQQRVHEAFCPPTQAFRVNCPITLSSYKHDAYTVLVVGSNRAGICLSGYI